MSYKRLRFEKALDDLYERLVDMDVEELCDELGISKEDILLRFKEKVYQYHAETSPGYDDLVRGLADDDDFYRNKERGFSTTPEDEDY